MNDVIINRKNLLGRRSPSNDAISGMILAGYAGTEPYGTVIKFQSIQEAELYGYTKEADAVNIALMHYHIREFFRINPDGTLYFMAVEFNTAMATMLDHTNAPEYAEKMLIEANGEIRQLAVGINADAGYDADTSNGIDQDVLDAIEKAKLLVTHSRSQKRPLVVLIEGRELVDNTLDLSTSEAEMVGVVIAQDWDKANMAVQWNKHAAIGTFLGSVSKVPVNENIGWVEKYRIDDGVDYFKTVGFSNHVKYKTTAPNTLNQYDQHALLFLRNFPGVVGYFWNDDDSCVTGDKGLNQISLVRTMDKAARMIYASLVPKLNSTIPVDPVSGKLAPSMCAYFEKLAYQGIEQMMRDGEVSGIDTWVDPDQNILALDKLNVKYSIVPTGTARKIQAIIEFTNPINS